MATDYILFIHGVNTREERENPEYADQLFNRLDKTLVDHTPDIQKVALYWGNVNEKAENNLLEQLRDSPLWSQMYFQTFREKQILQFAGDAALYISRGVGFEVITTLIQQTLQGLQKAQPNDRLHLVTHSWGTVILFDLLFASRWDDPNVPGYNEVMEIRNTIYGIRGNNPNPLEGIKIASIHTMGSPVAIFSLMYVAPSNDNTHFPRTHDITPKLKELLSSLHETRKSKKLPWRNYIHPGDPISYPLEKLMSSLVNDYQTYLDIQDVITHEAGLLDFITNQTVLALLHGGDAHGSYWHSEKVVKEISNVIRQEASESS